MCQAASQHKKAKQCHTLLFKDTKRCVLLNIASAGQAVSHLHCCNEVQEDLALVIGCYILNVLDNQICGGSNTAHRQEDVIVHEVSCQPLDLLGEGSTEQQGLPVTAARHVLSLYNAPNLRFKSHVQHAVSLIQRQIVHHLQGDSGPLNEVTQSAGCGHQDVTAALNFTQLHTEPMCQGSVLY